MLNGGELDGVRIVSAATIQNSPNRRRRRSASSARARLGYRFAYSGNRGELFPIGSFCANTGFTGTSLWIDPNTQTYVILLATAFTPRASFAHRAARKVATIAARRWGLRRAD